MSDAVNHSLTAPLSSSDAARVHSPSGGQGINTINTSVQDAVGPSASLEMSSLLTPQEFHLSWKLAPVYKGLSPGSLPATYTAERLPVIPEILNLTTDILKRIHGESKA
ncbi:hypothetical protein EDD15DRAFT_149448 [Pisolithus albus]|nr:hypothetical protein EDD15DRAFT_149448 [Pisolithus albus]